MLNIFVERGLYHREISVQLFNLFTVCPTISDWLSGNLLRFTVNRAKARSVKIVLTFAHLSELSTGL